MADEQKTQVQSSAATQPAPGTQSASGESAAVQSGKVFTQEQLEAIIAERLARERTKYADYDELKKAHEQNESAKKSEIEKAADRAAKAEAKLKEFEQSARLAELRAGAQIKAVEIGFDHKRLDKVLKLIDITNETTQEIIAAALDALAKDMPELLARKSAPVGGITNPTKADATETRDARMARLRGGGQLDNWLGGGSLNMYGKQPAEK